MSVKLKAVDKRFQNRYIMRFYVPLSLSDDLKSLLYQTAFTKFYEKFKELHTAHKDEGCIVLDFYNSEKDSEPYKSLGFAY